MLNARTHSQVSDGAEHAKCISKFGLSLLVLFRHIEFLHLATYEKQKQKNGMDWSTTLLETCLLQVVKLGRFFSLLDAPCHTTTPSVMHTLADNIRLSC